MGFIIGLFIGAFIGVMMMACLVASRDTQRGRLTVGEE